MQEEKIFEQVLAAVGRVKSRVAFNSKDKELIVMSGQLPEDERCKIECTMTVDRATVIAKASMKQTISVFNKSEVHALLNELNNVHNYVTFAVSTDGRFYVKEVIDTNRAELTDDEVIELLYDVTKGVMLVGDYVRRVDNGEMPGHIAFMECGEEYEDRIKKIDVILEKEFDEQEWDDDEPSDDIDDDMSDIPKDYSNTDKLSILCDALNNEDDEGKLPTVVSDQVEYVALFTGDEINGIDGVTRYLSAKAACENPSVRYHKAILTKSKEDPGDEEVFPVGAECIVHNKVEGDARTIIYFVSYDDEDLIDGIYLDDAELYEWKEDEEWPF